MDVLVWFSQNSLLFERTTETVLKGLNRHKSRRSQGLRWLTVELGLSLEKRDAISLVARTSGVPRYSCVFINKSSVRP